MRRDYHEFYGNTGGNYRNERQSWGRGGYNRRGDSIIQTQIYNELTNVPAVLPKESISITLNAFELDLKKAKTFYQYDLQWKCTNLNGKEYYLNKQTKFDKNLHRKKETLFKLFHQMIEQNKNYFKKDDALFIYDSGATFYCKSRLLKDEEIRSFNLEVPKFIQEAMDFFPKDIKHVTANIKLTNTIVPQLNGELNNDQPIIQFYEIVLGQTERLSDGLIYYEKQCYDKLGSEKIETTPYTLNDGFKRSVTIHGDIKNNKLKIEIFPTRGVFYGKDTTVKDLMEFGIKNTISRIWESENLKLAEITVQNLTVKTNHLQKNKIFVISGLSQQSCDRILFENHGKITSVYEYFRSKYNIIVNKEWPCLYSEQKYVKRTYFPIEVIDIIDHQRLQNVQELSSKIIRKCQISPDKMVSLIQKYRENSDILNINPYIKETGARVSSSMISAPAVVLQPPTIVFKSTQKTLSNSLDFGRLNDCFFEPATVQKLAIIVSSKYDVDIKYFLNKFLLRLRQYGVKIMAHEVFQCYRQPDIHDYKEYNKNGFDYLFIIGNEDDLHHSMKYAELETKLVTQHAWISTVKNSNNNILDKLAYKFNLKAGGLNWSISDHFENRHNFDLLKTLISKTLFIGIDLASSTDDVVTIGFASSLYNNNCNMTKGSFGYQKKNSYVESELLSKFFEDSMKSYFRSNGEFCNTIIVYRTGSNAVNVKQEVQVMLETIKKLKEQNDKEFPDVNLVFLNVNKKSTSKIFKEKFDQRRILNAPSGTLLADTNDKFYLIGQKCLVGTARVPEYTIIHNYSKIPVHHLQLLTYSICFVHGIVDTPTTLPSPCLSALDLSKRARHNMIYHTKQLKDQRYHVSEETIIRKESDYKTLNEILRAGITQSRFWA